MLQLHEHGDLALEARERHYTGELRRQELDDHLPRQLGIGREKEPALTAGRQLALDDVLTVERGLQRGKKGIGHASCDDYFLRAARVGVFGAASGSPSRKAFTATAWPFSFTFSHTRSTLPAASITYVVRITPMYLRP